MCVGGGGTDGFVVDHGVKQVDVEVAWPQARLQLRDIKFIVVRHGDGSACSDLLLDLLLDLPQAVHLKHVSVAPCTTLWLIFARVRSSLLYHATDRQGCSLKPPPGGYSWR